ncbi:hypothetical protein [Nigerium sp.]|uniref:hypothetical protein n=1 Tax=Nigerium sp. TaxID=2042655 RepID=UPI00322191EA
MDADPAESAAPITRRQAGLVAFASVLAAASNFVLMFAGTRTLSSEAATEYLAFWSLLTGMFGVVSGVQNESTRAVGAVAQGRAAGVRMIAPALAVGGIVAAAIVLFSPVLAARVVPLSASVALPALVLVTVAYAAYVTLVGSFGGRGWWTHYAALMGGEVVWRMALVGAAVAWGATLGRLELALAGATTILLIFLAAPRSRSAITSRADAGFRRILRQCGLAVLSTSCTALLITAYPAILKAANHGDDALLLGGLMLAISLTRAPILMPLTAFQGVAIRTFLEHRDAPLRALAKPAGALLALGLVGGAAAWFVGPWFLPLFGQPYPIPGWVFFALTFSSAFMGILTLLGTLVLALDAHLVYAGGWLAASVVALGLLVGPFDLTLRAVSSLALGPLGGCAVMLAWLMWSARTGQPSRKTTPMPDRG